MAQAFRKHIPTVAMLVIKKIVILRMSVIRVVANVETIVIKVVTPVTKEIATARKEVTAVIKAAMIVIRATMMGNVHTVQMTSQDKSVHVVMMANNAVMTAHVVRIINKATRHVEEIVTTTVVDIKVIIVVMVATAKVHLENLSVNLNNVTTAIIQTINIANANRLSINNNI